jgi:hypothetical protein
MNLKKCDSCGNRHMCFLCENNEFYRKVNWSRDEYIKREAIKEFSQRILERLEEEKKLFIEAHANATWTPDKIAYVNTSNGIGKAIEIVKEEGRGV